MSKMWLVARYELLTNIRKRSFLAAAFIGPLFTLGITALIFFITFQAESTVGDLDRIGVVDEAGVIRFYDDLTASIENPAGVLFAAYATADEARTAFEAGIIGGYMVLPPDYLDSGEVRLFIAGSASEAFSDAVSAYLRRNLGGDLPEAELTRLAEGSSATLRFLDSGRVLPIEALIGLVIVPILFVVLFMLTAQTASGYLMGGVVEEKSNRIMEILITSLRPIDLLAGKILGLGVLGLVQLGIWGGIAAIGAQFVGQSPFLSGLVVPPDLMVMGVIYFLLGYAFMATSMATIGVIIGAEQEARQYAGLFSLLFAAPFFAIIAFFTEPNGTVVTALSLVPLTSPTSMLMRMTFTAVPLEQHLLAVALLIAMNGLILWAGARVFRFALLNYGKRLSVNQVIGLLRRRRPNELLTAPAAEATAGGAQ